MICTNKVSIFQVWNINSWIALLKIGIVDVFCLFFDVLLGKYRDSRFNLKIHFPGQEYGQRLIFLFLEK
jgi:hypothetical protein